MTIVEHFAALIRPALSVLFVSLVFASLVAQAQSACGDTPGGLVLSGTARNWQFLDAVGPHAGIFGREDGNLEAWIFPLKLFRDFHLIFHAGDRVIAAEALPRTITVRPELTVIRYESDSFTVCETLFSSFTAAWAPHRIAGGECRAAGHRSAFCLTSLDVAGGSGRRFQ